MSVIFNQICLEKIRGEMYNKKQTALRFVLLHHVLRDGSSHFDWMFAQDGVGEMPLVTYRVIVPPYEAELSSAIAIERISDHRFHYLEYEGPIDQDRGTVQRVGEGTYQALPKQSTNEIGRRICWCKPIIQTQVWRFVDGQAIRSK